METLDTVFKALSDPTRRAILARLAHGEATVDQISEPFEMSQPSISRHLKVLETAGLISSRVEGTARPRKIEAKPFMAISDWLEQYQTVWEANFARLDTLLSELVEKEADH
ncbi:metalloregulator ArsR/SmtB family transcription factor [Roseibium sp. HPY-6]|uniref:ArsR/SmtB family transcription factor n=1 Tax=Roseibium sp. HPY-6 TaxID=3229852 RepID=UPI0033902D89